MTNLSKSIHREPKRRSRFGCRNCKKRKIKCSEARPSCENCIKSNRHCDYSIQLKWEPRAVRKATNKAANPKKASTSKRLSAKMSTYQVLEQNFHAAKQAKTIGSAAPRSQIVPGNPTQRRIVPGYMPPGRAGEFESVSAGFRAFLGEIPVEFQLLNRRSYQLSGSFPTNPQDSGQSVAPVANEPADFAPGAYEELKRDADTADAWMAQWESENGGE
ncbi:MAG: hypothetical protein Q9162_000733 [Coniocarpon cinnabarinum]